MTESTCRRKAKATQGTARLIASGGIIAVVAVLAIFAPKLAPYDPRALDLSLRLAAPSAAHWLGCDQSGQDILTSLLYGARQSLAIASATIALSFTVGTLAGLFAGFLQGWVDTLIMRAVDVLMAFPGILLAMALAALLGPSPYTIVIAIAATGWTSPARLVRGQVLAVKQRDFVVAAQAMGASTTRLLARHIFPEVLSHLLVQATFSLSGVILVEASLSFLGLGAPTETPPWGALLDQGRTVLTEAPHLSIFPGLAIMTIVLAFNFFGDGLRDLLDPKRAR